MDISHWFVAKIVLFGCKDQKYKIKRPGLAYLKNISITFRSFNWVVELIENVYFYWVLELIENVYFYLVTTKRFTSGPQSALLTEETNSRRKPSSSEPSMNPLAEIVLNDETTLFR